MSDVFQSIEQYKKIDIVQRKMKGKEKGLEGYIQDI